MKALISRLDELNKSVENASETVRKQAGKLVNTIQKSNGQIKKALKTKKRHEVDA